MSILIVDDSLVSRTFIGDLLNEFGFSDLILCHSVEEAYQIIGFNESDRISTELDLILLDINLPGKNGLEACREFSAHAVFGDTPIIIISGADHLEGLDAAFSAGATDYITKPPSHTELLARVRSALRLKSEMNRRRAREAELLVLNQRLAEMNLELEKLSTTDSLTGLANRRFFNEFLSREWMREQRGKQPFSIIMIDIDHFKKYNDHYGHPAGDLCLQKVSKALQSALCRGGDMLARYGGEEFIAILPHTDLNGATELAASFHSQVRELGILHCESAVSSIVTISAGIASVIPDRNLSSAQVIAMADKALYRAKAAGRNQSMAASPIPQDESES
ncbi:MAG: diguanylate cyclase [Desulfuromonadales bacterium]|nr:diguanylate cyclase [Desulfuromonadales bacterium]